ncbi:unnamed protein product [Sphenostylis stenocarpa]|uniref:Uncharacterized protein n=1 Tax=Sphenostylis stenocarpa TaxID=92480 RepID=A0AA86STM0_9FABA|nr:unnamed protein product [Sphenostylis stenocarpa]
MAKVKPLEICQIIYEKMLLRIQRFLSSSEVDTRQNHVGFATLLLLQAIPTLHQKKTPRLESIFKDEAKKRPDICFHFPLKAVTCINSPMKERD